MINGANFVAKATYSAFALGLSFTLAHKKAVLKKTAQALLSSL